jgi:3-polyprenyl-4-hydroxybenzoate decarboxylase
LATGGTFTVACRDVLTLLLRLPNFGSKMGVDATCKWPSEGFTRPWPDEIKMDPEAGNREQVTGDKEENKTPPSL